MRAAIGVLEKAQRPGRHEEFAKFSAARKARSVHANVFKASAKGSGLSLCGRSDKRRSVVSKNPMDSEFFSLFIKGLELRIGQRAKRDQALSVAVVVKMQEMAEEEWKVAVESRNKGRERAIAEWVSCFLCTFAHGLQGWETVKAAISQLRSQLADERLAQELGIESHVGLPLRGRFKSCGNSDAQLLCMTAGETASGLQPVKWVSRLLAQLDEDGVRSDWLFQNACGERRSMTDFNETFCECLSSTQRNFPELTPDDADITEDFHLARSFRQGATTRAQLMDAPNNIVEWVNRWGAGTEILVRGPMRVICSDRKLMLDHFLRFSRAL